MNNKAVFAAVIAIIIWLICAGRTVLAQDVRTKADARMIAQVMRQAQRLRPQLRREIRLRERRYGPSDRIVKEDRQTLRQIDHGLALYSKLLCLPRQKRYVDHSSP